MDGRGPRDKRPPVWPHALSLHWTILSWHGRLVAVYIAGFVPLGSQPWLVLAILIAGGNALADAFMSRS
jgi:hypothetical protein